MSETKSEFQAYAKKRSPMTHRHALASKTLSAPLCEILDKQF